MIGPMLQRATMPKLSSSSCERERLAMPVPIAIRNGTVIGPVVTPPESKATATKLSIEKQTSRKIRA